MLLFFFSVLFTFSSDRKFLCFVVVVVFFIFQLFVSCSLGLEAVGEVMLTRGIVGLAGTWLVHEFVRYIHRPLILAAGAFCQVGVFSILSLWRSDADLPLYYVVAGCWALSGAIWETLLLSKYFSFFFFLCFFMTIFVHFARFFSKRHPDVYEIVTRS